MFESARTAWTGLVARQHGGDGVQASRALIRGKRRANETAFVTGGNWLSESDDPGWAITREGAIFEDFVEVQNPAGIAAGAEQYHLRSHGIYVERSFRVTVADSHLEKAEHLGGAGNGYLYQVSRSNEILMRDCIGREGRHNFSINWDFGSSGNVFLRIESTAGLVCGSLQDQLDGNCSEGPTDFHHALAMANLFDNSVINDALQVGNRQDWSSGAGQTGTMNVFWNTSGSGNVYAYNQGMGYVVGTSPSISVSTDLTLTSWPQVHVAPGTEPEDFTEYLGQSSSLAPVSLFEEQLARRLAQ